MSIEIFLHHPYVAQIKPDYSCYICYSQIENPNDFSTCKSSDWAPLTINKEVFDTVVDLWLKSKKITLQRIAIGIFDFSNKKLYAIDFVGERQGEIFLILAYYSNRRRSENKKIIMKQAQEISSLCTNQYKIDVRVAVVNVYAEGKTEGTLY
jgi:hypothetical protein